MRDLARVAQRFPLIARARPACRPLHERVNEIGELARAAAEQPTYERLFIAARAHNKAALIASDCGLPDLARTLCWRQANTYLRARPLPAQAARYALEPLVNLARLLIRDGDGDGAFRLLDTLYHAVRSRADAMIDGRQVRSQDLTSSDEDHRAVCQWLWTVLLADGTRALANAGRWDQALAHAKRHGGIGRRLLDGRQVAILTSCFTGNMTSALTLLADCALTELWERAVASCLTVLCLASNTQPVGEAVATMVEHYLALDPAPDLVVFRTRLGLTLIDLIGGVEKSRGTEIVTRLAAEAVATGDGYAARDVLAHHGCRTQLRDTERRALSTTVQASGLERGSIPAHLMDDLQAALTMSETTTARILATRVLLRGADSRARNQWPPNGRVAK